jgi:hypothetical protein
MHAGAEPRPFRIFFARELAGSSAAGPILGGRVSPYLTFSAPGRATRSFAVTRRDGRGFFRRGGSASEIFYWAEI